MEGKQIRELLKEDIRQAQMVLVGIGQEFAWQAVKSGSVGTQEAEKQRERTKMAYQELASLVDGKNYFIVTLCMDDLIYETSLDAERLVAPCGGRRFLQCAAGCCEILTEAATLPEEQRKKLETGDFPVCSQCGARLCYNNIESTAYVEAGYLPQWEKYRKWLSGTVNRRLCILELGVGIEFPSIVRWPFEKIAYLNEKARFYRVHSRLYQLTEEMKDRAVSAAENPVDFLLQDGK